MTFVGVSGMSDTALLFPPHLKDLPAGLDPIFPKQRHVLSVSPNSQSLPEITRKKKASSMKSTIDFEKDPHLIVIKEGYLLKKKSGGKKFNKRYCKLYVFGLQTLDKNSKLNESMSKCKLFQFKDFNIVKVFDSEIGESVMKFVNKLNRQKEIHFRSSNLVELEQWFNEIEEQIEKSKEMNLDNVSLRPGGVTSPRGVSPRTNFAAKKLRPISHSFAGKSSSSRAAASSCTPKRKSTLFGVLLEELLPEHVNNQCNIPNIVLQTTKHLEAHLTTEGIFRKSASSVILNQLKDQYDQHTVNLKDFDDPHLIAGLLKTFLRDLPTPLLTYDLFDEWAIFAGATPTEKLNIIKNTHNKLPSRYKETWEYLVLFFRKVIENQASNMMSTSNMAIVITPNVFKKLNQTMVDTFSTTSTGNEIVTFYLEKAPEIFVPCTPQ